MRKKRYDVVVVGCGPGGAIAGKFAALNGADTLVIEERRQLGFPVYDSMSIIYGQSQMEEITGEKVQPAVIFAKADGLGYVSHGGKEGKPQLMEDGIFVNRQLFEKDLAIGAVRAGAEIMLHTRVVDLIREGSAIKGVVIKTVSGTESIPCSVVIAADGSYQFMARLAGMKVPKKSASCKLGCEFAGAKLLGKRHRIDEIYLSPTGEGTYGTVVPYVGDRMLVGLACSPSVVKEKKSLKVRLDEFLRHLEKVGKYDFTKASPVSMIVGGQATTLVPSLALDGFMAIGNAAGAPLFGSRWGGTGLMAGACWTGRVAGEIAAEAVKKGNFSGKALEPKYKASLDDSLKGHRARIDEAGQAYDFIRNKLTPQEQDQAIAEIGQAIAAMHFYSRGCLAPPLPPFLETAQEWLKKYKKQ